jgi:hypothetical protein
MDMLGFFRSEKWEEEAKTKEKQKEFLECIFEYVLETLFAFLSFLLLLPIFHF